MDKACFVELDLRQAEWIVTAFAAQEPKMMDIYWSGKDPHLSTGSLLSGAPSEIVYEDNKLVGHATDPLDIAAKRKAFKVETMSKYYFPRSMSIRQAGKKSNHGFNYRMGYKRFALENEVKEAEAKIIHSKYHQAYPGLNSWYEEIEHTMRTTRTLLTCFGDKRKFLSAHTTEMVNEAISWLPQTTVARVTKYGMGGIYQDPRMAGKVDLRANVHDSVLVRIVYSSIEELVKLIRIAKSHMGEHLEYHHREFTLRVDAKVVVNWGYMEEIPEKITDEGVVQTALEKSVAETEKAQGR